MRPLAILSCLIASISSTSAWNPPRYPNHTLNFNESFTGRNWSLPDQKMWNIITGYLNVNSEEEVYTDSIRNLRHSGNNTFQIMPTKDGSKWMSGRIESKETITPIPGRITFVEAAIRFGNDTAQNRKGWWPAFWMLGNSSRETPGIKWPACGEIDIMETKNGESQAYGSVHCDKLSGGACSEPKGISSPILIPNQSWHIWRVEWDLTSADTEIQTITWYLDGKSVISLTSWDIPSTEAWKMLTQTPMFIILNVAVGGQLPGHSNSSTHGGEGAMMEVGYVASYVSS